MARHPHQHMDADYEHPIAEAIAAPSDKKLPVENFKSTSGKPPKVSIIGAGMVGSSLGYSLVVERVAGEVVLVDINRDRAQGEAKDIAHAVPFRADRFVHGRSPVR